MNTHSGLCRVKDWYEVGCYARSLTSPIFLTYFICGAWNVKTTLGTSQGQSEAQIYQGWGHKFVVLFCQVP